MKYLKNNFPVDLYKDDYDLNTAVDILIEYIGAYSKDAYNGIDKNLQEYEVYIKHIWKSLIKNKRDYVDRDCLLNIIKGLKLIDECGRCIICLNIYLIVKNMDVYVNDFIK